MVYKQSILMVGGTILNALLGLIFYVLAARTLSVSDFGQFMFFLTVGLIVAEIGDFGFTNSLIKFGSGKNFSKVFSAVFLQRAVLIAVLIVAAFFFPVPALIGVSLLLFSLGYQGLIARQEYNLYLIDNLVGNLVRLAALYFLGPSWAFIWANLFAFTLAFLFLRLKFGKPILTFKGIRAEFLKVAGFSGWLGSSYSLASLASKIDIPILYAFAGPAVVGIYSSAQKLASVIPQIAATVENVFSPKLSKGDKVFKDYFLITLFIGFGLLMASFLSPWLILPFGPKYAQSATILAIFFIGFIPLFLSGSFAASILYHYGKSQWHFYVNLFSLIFSTVFYFILTPKFGGHGAAIVIACSNFLSFVLYYLLWRYQTKKLAIN